MRRQIFLTLLLTFFLCAFGSNVLADWGYSDNISNSTASSKYPAVARKDGAANVYVVWVEDELLYFSKSSNLGTSWSTPYALTVHGEITGGTTTPRHISIEAEGEYVHVVMQWRSTASDDFEIWYRRNTNNGENADWDSWMQLTVNSASSVYPDVAVRGEYVHVTYQDMWPGNYEIMYKRITNYGGGSVDQTRRLTYSNPGQSYYPRIAVSAGGYTVSIVYEDDYSGYFQIYYKHIDNYGAGAYQTYQLTFGSYFSGLPDIVTSAGSIPDDQYIYIVYVDFWPGNREVMYKRLDIYGNAGFSQYMHRLTYSSTSSDWPRVDFDTAYGNVHIVYEDYWTGNWDIMIKQLPSYGGGGFSTDRISWGSGSSLHAGVVAFGVWALIVWDDDSSGNRDILEKYGY